MSIPNGYNNPAYCHQYDSSLYDYQYVPEIDPDSPDLNADGNRRQKQTKLVHPTFANFDREFSESDDFEGSDESNRSIIIEECNNRRVTLICEKRNKKEEYYGDDNNRGAYYQDISLDSENGYDQQKRQERSLRHQRPLEPPAEQSGSTQTYVGVNGERRMSSTPSFKQSTASINGYQRQQRCHRYEEIQAEEQYPRSSSKVPVRVHRYAEIEDEYQSGKESQVGYQPHGGGTNQREYHQQRAITKPRAISPINCPQSFSPPVTPSRTSQRNLYSPSYPSPVVYSSSPMKNNSFEMAELSPPRSEYSGSDQTFFMQSPKRHPPIGASSPNDLQERYPTNGRCILPKNLQKVTTKSGKSHSVPNSPKRNVGGSKAQSEKKVTHIFHKPKSAKDCTPTRRNISSSFTDPPPTGRSPYKPTTAEMPTRTAIITPIFQRKQQTQDSPKRTFEKMSHAFQSTGDIHRSARDQSYQPAKDRGVSPARIKRNQSVPNFSQSLAAESRRQKDTFRQDCQKYSRNLDLQYSPTKPQDHLTGIDKSRISLIDQTSSWSNLDSEVHSSSGYCLIVGAMIQLITATATCAISFYLFSKVGRKYYLDFGILAGFVNFILGLLGFRSHCWRWLPNRNYVSGFIVLTAFSVFTCAGLSYIITARPMIGDPILDVMGGAICGVSVLTILLALTGLTMSGCCKTPPPDNRVNNL